MERSNDLIERVKQRKEKLFGFGHGVYKSYDPRAHILRSHAPKVLAKTRPLAIHSWTLPSNWKRSRSHDDYFVSRNLYPNVDFYSGILLRAIGIPTNMYTVMFAIGRMPGWIANWKEVRDTDSRIYRPRQIYTGPATQKYVPVDDRG